MTVDLTPPVILAAAATALGVGVLVRILVPAPRRLRARVLPYVSPTHHLLRSAPNGVVMAVFGPIIRDSFEAIGRVLDRSSRPASLLRLRQAGWFRSLSESEMMSRYRLEQVKPLVSALVVAAVFGMVVDGSVALRIAVLALASVFGATRTRGRIDKAIEQRREVMRIEIYTINQLLAMRIRAGGGIVHTVKAITSRGRGEVVHELAEALRLHRAGWQASDAFRRIAELTPEPFCSRTYRVLASAEERGADLAGALLALSEDVREARRESIKRTGTKRRAAMLIPIIAVLAPVLILFVAAPLPYLITSWQ